MQKQLGLDAGSATDEDVVKAANIERNKIMKQIKVLLKSEIEEKEEKIISKLEESAKNPNLTFNIIKEIYKNKSKEDLYLIEDNKMIMNQDEVTKKITEHFSNIFLMIKLIFLKNLLMLK